MDEAYHEASPRFSVAPTIWRRQAGRGGEIVIGLSRWIWKESARLKSRPPTPP
jgi:hypothetical protein